MMSVPDTSVRSSMSNSGTMRFGLVNEMLPREMWNVLPARYTSPPSRSVMRPASDRVADGPADAQGRTRFEAPVVVVEPQILQRRHEQVEAQLLDPARRSPAGGGPGYGAPRSARAG